MAENNTKKNGKHFYSSNYSSFYCNRTFTCFWNNSIFYNEF